MRLFPLLLLLVSLLAVPAGAKDVRGHGNGPPTQEECQLLEVYGPNLSQNPIAKVVVHDECVAAMVKTGEDETWLRIDR